MRAKKRKEKREESTERARRRKEGILFLSSLSAVQRSLSLSFSLSTAAFLFLRSSLFFLSLWPFLSLSAAQLPN